MNKKGESKLAKKIKAYVKQDVRDDFWPDIIEYEDLFDQSLDLKANHTFSPIKIMDIPKPSKVLRPGHYISFIDRIYYFKLVLDFCSKIVRKMSPKEVSYSYRVSLTGSGFIRYNINAWKDFIKRQENDFNKNPDGLMVETDITAFFEHIVISKLVNRIEILLNKKPKDLEEALKKWSGDLHIGIPQGNDTSSFLGNLYLDQVDKVMIESGFNYYRFTDDIRIFVKNEKEAEVCLIKLTETLRELNLHLNSSKTRILTKERFESEKNKLENEMRMVEYGFEKGLYTKLTEGDKKEVLKCLKKIFKESVSNDEIDERNLKFCVNRFRRLGSNYPLDKILKIETWSPAIVKEICSYLKDMSLLERKKVQEKIIEEYNKSSYEYAKIHFLRLLVYAKVVKSLKDLDYINDINSDNFMLRGYLIVYILKFFTEAKQGDAIRIARNNIGNFELIRYFAIGSNFIIDPHKKKTEQKNILERYSKFKKLFDSKNLEKGSNLEKIVNKCNR